MPMPSTDTPCVPSPGSSGSPASAWNPWPAGLGVFFALLISTIAGFIVFAVRQDMDLVRPDYYEQELQHSRQMERVRRTRDLAPDASITAGPDALRISLPPGHSGKGFTGTLRLYRPSDASLDQRIPMAPDPSGRQTVPVNGLRPGLWRVQADWTLDGLDFHLEAAVVVPAKPERR